MRGRCALSLDGALAVQSGRRRAPASAEAREAALLPRARIPERRFPHKKFHLFPAARRKPRPRFGAAADPARRPRARSSAAGSALRAPRTADGCRRQEPKCGFSPAHRNRCAAGPEKDDMKPFYKKILSFLTIICCVAGSLGTVRASESEGVPRAVFTNEQKDLPDLYIGKTVVSPEGYTAPAGDAFTFLLTLNGASAGSRSYVLCDLNGTELTKDQVNKILGLNKEQNSFQTVNGTFTLRDGLMAKFTGVGVGTEYDVSELLPEDALYEQTFPEGGASAHGFMTAGGEEIVFTNTYTPRSQEGRAVLEVKKTIAFPAGLTAPQTPDFTFTLTVAGELYKDKAYTVRDALGNAVRTGTTSGTGTFTLRGGQTAVFAGDDLEAGLDYAVTEQASAGWHTVSTDGTSGSLAAPVTRASFHNSEVSFAVTKEVQGTNTRPDRLFTFQLAREDGSLWSGAEYYLYDPRGNLLSEDNAASAPADPSGPDAPTGLTPPAGGDIAAAAEAASDATASVGGDIAATVEAASDATVSVGGDITASAVTASEDSSNSAVPTDSDSNGSIPAASAVTSDAAAAAEQSGTDGTAAAAAPAADGADAAAASSGADAGGVPPAADAGSVPAVQSAVTASESGGASAGTLAVKQHTRDDGTFTLKAGQTAVFTGLAQGTHYSVSEVGSPDYIQVQPASVEGYTDRIVQDSPLVILPFKNKEAPVVPTLAVTKVVENKKGDAFDPQESFHFILRKKEGSEWKTVNRASYTVTVGSEEFKEATGPNEAKGLDAGEFVLRANETARFTTLLRGEYQVEEIGLGGKPAYQFGSVTVTHSDDAADGADSSAFRAADAGAPAPLSDEPDVGGSASSGSSTTIPGARHTAEGTLGVSGTTGFVFSNHYWSEKTDLQILKTNPSGEALEGAEFNLLKAETDSEGDETGTPSNVATGTSGADGKITFDVPLTEGIWYVEETKAPNGYHTLEGSLKLVVTNDNINHVPQVELTGGKEGQATFEVVTADNTRNQIVLTIKDEYAYSLPSTGGTGTAPYTLAGIALLTAAVFLYIRKRKPGRS